LESVSAFLARRALRTALLLARLRCLVSLASHLDRNEIIALMKSGIEKYTNARATMTWNPGLTPGGGFSHELLFRYYRD
jgi:hypothetical protein